MAGSTGWMARALVVYSGADGATRHAAEEIASGMSRAGGVTTLIASVEEVRAERIAASDIVVLGSPASAREAVRELRHLTEILPAGTLERKTVSIFDAGTTGHRGAGARKLREVLREVDPGLQLATPGISLVVDRARRELSEPELARCRQFGEHLAGVAAAAGWA
jgi:flavorubredoxin